MKRQMYECRISVNMNQMDSMRLHIITYIHIIITINEVYILIIFEIVQEDCSYAQTNKIEITDPYQILIG